MLQYGSTMVNLSLLALAPSYADDVEGTGLGLYPRSIFLSPFHRRDTDQLMSKLNTFLADGLTKPLTIPHKVKKFSIG